MATRIIVDKDDLSSSSSIEMQLKEFCKDIINQADSLILIPKPGNIIPLVILLSTSKISYVFSFSEEKDVAKSTDQLLYKQHER